MEPQRFGMLIRLRPEKREEYLELHAAVWPAVEQTMLDANMRNFTIFLHDDLLFGYYEYVGEDHAADQARIAADPETRRWWTFTDPCQESLAEPGSGHWWVPMREVWHLADPAARRGGQPS
ncbi:L-rhamnose 1-epimerase [Lentzea guizhouensis]|uniref:L-rhamnose 1-epimerase n=1 Tax=Lentzea guizhouensis TaxID=1586287 RepID=A0A1B2HTX3_9PSEU|nr:L-rhamnose mutarotase [Lentzea guizhouensis]ANZ41135.1 L-rhamnose 1-epimerase [Lentzea guizhouensis]